MLYEDALKAIAAQAYTGFPGSDHWRLLKAARELDAKRSGDTVKAIFTIPRPDGGTTDLVIIPDLFGFADTFTIYDRCHEGHTSPGETIHESGLTLREALDSAHSLALLLMEQ